MRYSARFLFVKSRFYGRMMFSKAGAFSRASYDWDSGYFEKLSVEGNLDLAFVLKELLENAYSVSGS